MIYNAGFTSDRLAIGIMLTPHGPLTCALRRWMTRGRFRRTSPRDRSSGRCGCHARLLLHAHSSLYSVPENAWEQTPYGRRENYRLASNEGPQQLTNPKTGQEFIIYSAARSDNRNYCLGQLELVGEDPMNPQDWKKNNEGCVFYQNPMEEAYGVGHASFTTSPDGTEDWVVYHGMRNYMSGWGQRTVRTQKFTWNEDGSPKFPRPGYGPYEVPSGQNASMSMF
jgi:GH43 family beta-xylosidase